MSAYSDTWPCRAGRDGRCQWNHQHQWPDGIDPNHRPSTVLGYPAPSAQLGPEDIDEARHIYRGADREWEFHDSSDAFYDFARWCQDNFEALLNTAAAAVNQPPNPR